MNSELQFVLSNRGNLQLLHKGYTFYQKWTSSQGITVWRCSKYNKESCKVTIRTSGIGRNRKIVMITGKHIDKPCLCPHLDKENVIVQKKQVQANENQGQQNLDQQEGMEDEEGEGEGHEEDENEEEEEEEGKVKNEDENLAEEESDSDEEEEEQMEDNIMKQEVKEEGENEVIEENPLANPREERLEERFAKANKQVYNWMAGIATNEIGQTIGDWDKVSLLKFVEMADQEIREHPEKLNVWLPWLKCAIPKCLPIATNRRVLDAFHGFDQVDI